MRCSEQARKCETANRTGFDGKDMVNKWHETGRRACGELGQGVVVDALAHIAQEGHTEVEGTVLTVDEQHAKGSGTQQWFYLRTCS